MSRHNIISQKTREQMYLKHLRQVEKISNRQASSIKKTLQSYHNVTEAHKSHRNKAFKFRLSEEKRSREKKNKQLHRKISSMQSDAEIKNSQKEYRYWQNEGQGFRMNLHYEERKKEQSKIEEGNIRLMKAIMNQKSTILPYIKKSKTFISSNIQ